MTKAGPNKAALLLAGLALATPLTLNLLTHALAPLHGDSFLTFVVRSDAGGLLGAGAPLAGGLLALALAVLAWNRQPYPASNRFGYRALAVFMGLGFLSAWLSEAPHDALVSWTMVAAAALAYLLGSLLVDGERLEELKHPCVAVSGVVALLSLLSYNPSGDRPVLESAFQTNSLGAYLLLLLPTVWWVLLEPALDKTSSWTRHLLVLPVVSAVLVCLMMTFSRGAQLVSVVQMVLLLAFLPGKPRGSELIPGALVMVGALLCLLNKLTLGLPLLLLSLLGMARRFPRVSWVAVCLIVAVILGGAIYQMVDPEGQAFQHANTRIQRLAKRDRSSATRLNLWKTAAMMSRDHPLLGVGSGNYRHYHPRYQNDFSIFSSSPHNALLTVSAEQGVPAALLILIFMLWNLKLGWSDLHTHPHRRGYLAAAVGVLGFLLFELLDVQLRYHLVLLTAAFLAGSLRADPGVGQTGAEPPRLARGLGVFFLVATTVYLWILAGRYFFFKANQNETVSAAQACLRLDPWDDDAYYLRAQREEQVQEALSAISKAIERAPIKASHYHLLGNILYKSGQPGESEAAFRRALALDPFNRPSVYFDLAQILAVQNRPDEARQVLEDALSRYPSEDLPRLHTIRMEKFGRDLALMEARLGEFLYDENRMNEAELHFRKSLLIQPSLRGHLGLGVLLCQTGRYQEALPQLEQVLHLKHGEPLALHFLAECYSKLGKPERAEAIRLRLSPP